MDNFIGWQQVSALNSGHHQAVIQEYECIHKPNMNVYTNQISVYTQTKYLKLDPQNLAFS